MAICGGMFGTYFVCLSGVSPNETMPPVTVSMMVMVGGMVGVPATVVSRFASATFVPPPGPYRRAAPVAEDKVLFVALGVASAPLDVVAEICVFTDSFPGCPGIKTSTLVVVGVKSA